MPIYYYFLYQTRTKQGNKLISKHVKAQTMPIELASQEESREESYDARRNCVFPRAFRMLAMERVGRKHATSRSIIALLPTTTRRISGSGYAVGGGKDGKGLADHTVSH